MPTPEELREEAAKEQRDIDLQNAVTAMEKKRQEIDKIVETLPENPSQSLLEKLDQKINEYHKEMDPIFDAVNKEMQGAFGQGLQAAWTAMCKAMIAFEAAGGKPLIALGILNPAVLLNPVKLLTALNPFALENGLLTGGVLDLKGWSQQTYQRITNTFNEGKRSRIEKWNAVKDLGNAVGAACNLWDKQEKIDPRMNKARQENLDKSNETPKKTAAEAFKPSDPKNLTSSEEATPPPTMTRT